MTPQFRLTKPAIQDIEQIADYIARESGLSQADRFLAKLDAKFAKIAQFPKIGRQRDEVLPRLRSFPMDQYLILYITESQNVDILRVVSGYRDLSALFTDSAECQLQKMSRQEWIKMVCAEKLREVQTIRLAKNV